MQKLSTILRKIQAKPQNYIMDNDSNYLGFNHKVSDPSHVLTEEQLLCVEAACSGKSLKIKAFAGSGKTSTLVEIAKKLSGRGLYLAYNKTIQLDAIKKFPMHVDCRTAHSIAYRENAHRIKGRVRNLNIFDIIEHVEISQLYNYVENDIAFLILKLLKVFANSNRQVVDHYFSNNAIFDEVSANSIEETESIIEYVINRTHQYWEQCIAEGSTLPIEHDFYLKMFQLSDPILTTTYDFIMFDECQDANPVLLDILSKQNCQKIYVGDEHQQIYSWRGSINAFAELGGEEYYLSQSFRLGEKKLLRGTDTIDSRIVEESPNSPLTILCRTNARIIEEIVKLYNKRLHVVGGVAEIINLAKSGYALFTEDIKNVRHLKLKQFKSWNAMLHFNYQYEDPDLTFLAKLIKEHGYQFKAVIHKIENAHYVAEDLADITISTIHKSKGREWDNVILNDDFLIFSRNDAIEEVLSFSPEELNLIYVAITRAQGTLFLTKGVHVFMDKLMLYDKHQGVKPKVAESVINIANYKECANLLDK
jgi:superfamily I DNA/RNA helicase